MKNLFFGGVLMLCSMLASAQDAHFSQYFAAPMLTNPALTGQMEGDTRFSMIGRTQWRPFKSDAYNTVAASFDVRAGGFGIGVMILDEMAGVNGLSQFHTTNALLSLSYDIMHRATSSSHLVVGVQGGLYSRYFDFDDATVPDQYQEGFGAIGEFNEGVSALNSISPDVNFGLLWFSGSSQTRLAPFIGVSAFHLVQPYEGFDEKKKLDQRFLGHAGLRIRTDKGLELIPHAKYSVQGKSYLGMGGVNLSYGITDTRTTLEGGIAYRLDDAIVAHIGLKINSLAFGFSYDSNVSQLSSIGRFKNAFEVSITYVRKKFSYKEEYICPRL